jgi:hypothetical protein
MIIPNQRHVATHSTHKREEFMPPMDFEPEIPAIERLQIHVLDGAATGIGFRHRNCDFCT